MACCLHSAQSCCLTRKSSSDFACTLVVGVPAIALYMMSVLAPPLGEVSGRRPWRALLATTSILLAPVAMLELLHWLGAYTGADLWLAAVFALTALLAVHAVRRTKAAYLALLAALSTRLPQRPSAAPGKRARGSCGQREFACRLPS
jgi:hypothetical protein